MQMNPIVKKDIRVQARSMRICWGLFAYGAIMAMVFFFAMFMFQMENAYSSSNIYSNIVMLYPVLAVTQIIILGVVVPIRTASSISGEKERQTFDIMMTTSMMPFSIILGKVQTAIVQGLFFVVAGMPVMALAFVIGGMSWAYLFWFFAIALLVSLFSASIGIFCSSVCKKSITAVIMSYGIYVIFFIVTLIPNMVCAILGYTDTGFRISFWLYLINPGFYLLEFFTWTMAGGSLAYEGYTSTGQGISTTLFSEAAVHYGWMTISSMLLILVSFCFLLIAAKRISPLSKHKAKKLGNVNQYNNMNPGGTGTNQR